MKAITFLLTTKEPVLATSFSGDPNSDVSYPYIPGSAIRGALIARYLKVYELEKEDILTDEDEKVRKVRRLFFNGTTRYLNAYLCSSSEEKKRTFPMLASWKKEKGAELKEDETDIDIYDFSEFSENKPKLESPKSVGEYYWVKEDGYVRLYSVSRRINIHNMRDRRKGRSGPDEINRNTNQVIERGEGEIFTYDAIDANQTFKGVILCDDGDEETIKELLNKLNTNEDEKTKNESNTIRLGGSISAGYGRTEISEIGVSDPPWYEVGVSPEDRANNNTLKITLLSDLIFRDEWGQDVAMPPTNLLAELLGKPLKELQDSLNLDKTYTKATLIGGFNRKWGLPLPQVPAVAAGSVFVYENVVIKEKEIERLEAEGIGERRVEGFGRLAVNWQSSATTFKPKLPPKKESKKPEDLNSKEERKLARDMAKRIMRQNLEKCILRELKNNPLNLNDMTNSQLSRLIMVARQGLDGKDASEKRKPLNELLQNLPSKAREQYKSTKLYDKIPEWLNNPEKWIRTKVKPVKVACQEIHYDEDDLGLEYTLRLIMAIAKNAIKENQKKND